MDNLYNIAGSIIEFINRILVPLVFALAFALFLFGVFRFFFLKSADPKSREEGRKFIVWAVVAFAVMVSVWGLVNLVANTFNLDKNMPNIPTFDVQQGSRSNPNTSTNPAPGATDNTAPVSGSSGYDVQASPEGWSSSGGAYSVPTDMNFNQSVPASGADVQPFQ